MDDKDKIILSIITPVYEPDPILFQRTVHSVMAAMQENWEWIIVLHNTRSLSPEDVYRMTTDNGSVHVYTKTDDVHASWSPRNFALTKANGKYLYFIDHDDEVKKEFLLRGLRKMEEDDCDILIGNAEKELTASGLFEAPIVLDFPETEEGTIVPDDPDIKGRLLYGAITLSCRIFRRDLIVDNAITFDRDILLTDDVLFALRCYCKAKKICVMPKLIAYTYVQNENSHLQRMLREDSFPLEIYTEPVRVIVNLALENNISPSGYLWMMMGMFTRIYQKSNMSAEKKRLLMSEIQKYIPLMKPSDKRKL